MTGPPILDLSQRQFTAVADGWRRPRLVERHEPLVPTNIMSGFRKLTECLHIASILDAITMATLTLKNVPDELYAQLKARAVEHRRSLNREAILCLEEALTPSSAKRTEATLKALRRSRLKLGKVFVTDRELVAARSSGRA